MEKAIIVRYYLARALSDPTAAQDEATRELNSYLADGWRVKHAFPMSGSAHELAAVSLVVIEKLGD